MKITKEIKERIDHRGNVVDFLFCFKCVTFIDISKNNIGDEIKCTDCHTDKDIHL